MSWSATGKISEGAYYQENFGGLNTPEHMEQFEQGVRGALAVVQSGAVGDPKADYKVTLSGHGNPEHKPTPGWANDALTVAVYQE